MNAVSKNNINKFIYAALVTIAITFAMCVRAFAADAEVKITGGEDVHNNDESYTVTVEISSSEQIGTYYIELEYDALTAAYVSGADSATEGTILLTGTGTDKKITYSINFKNKTRGAAGLSVSNAVVNDTSSNAMNVTAEGTEDIAAPDIPVVGSMQNEAGLTLYILDQSLFVPDMVSWNYKTVQGTFQGSEVTFLTDASENVHILYMADSNGNYYPYAVNESGEIYPVNEFGDQNSNTWTYTSAAAALTLPETLSENTDILQYAIYAINADGTGEFYTIDENSRMVALEDDSRQGASLQPWLIIVLIIIAVLIIAAIIVFLTVRKRSRNTSTKTQSQAKPKVLYKIEPDNIDAKLPKRVAELPPEEGSAEDTDAKLPKRVTGLPPEEDSAEDTDEQFSDEVAELLSEEEVSMDFIDLEEDDVTLKWILDDKSPVIDITEDYENDKVFEEKLAKILNE